MARVRGRAVEADLLLQSKVYIPTPRPGFVPRRRLVDRLESGLRGRLTLVSAPPGFGKSSLLAEWLAAAPHDRQAAWVSLDASDNVPSTFWAYVLAALERAGAGLEGHARTLLRSPDPPSTEAILARLVNGLASAPREVVLVLDDYHVIESREIHDGVASLLDHVPPRLHLLLATRSDPPLALGRMRARGQLTELRAADLRFTANEAAAFLAGSMGLDVTAEDVAALEARTEGWAAGLQLAALSLQGRDDIAGFVATFAGDDRYVVDYLVEEVLHRQPEHVRSFLLQTSILERLSGPLCDAVTGRDGGSATLEELLRANLFVTPLDTSRRWYRYHHLFADVLQAHLLAERSEEVPGLHRRASEWHEEHGDPAEAIRHALAGGDIERAATLIERAWREMDRRRQSARWLSWVRQLPEEVVGRRPVLGAGYGWALLALGELEAAEARLRQSERALDGPATGPRSERHVAGEAEYAVLRGTIAAARAYRAQALGDVKATAEYARAALEVFPDDDDLRRGSPGALLAMASWTTGDLEVADRALSEATALAERAGNLQYVVTATYVLADLKRTRGRAREAFEVLHRTLDLAATEDEDEALRGTADVRVGLAEWHLARNDLDAAADELRRSEALGTADAPPHWRARWCRAQAALARARGDHEAALAALDEGERHVVRGPVPELRPFAACRARVWLEQGRHADALEWARRHDLAATHEASFLREFELVTLAMALIARYRHELDQRSIQEAEALLERLHDAAKTAQRTGSLIEILVVQALAMEARRDVPRALVPLARALALAEPEENVRVFLEGGEHMRDLLRHAAASGISSTYVRRLLDAFEASPPRTAPREAAGETVSEPLTPREIEVVRLVAAGMRNAEIAEHLVISQATVKRHIANAYGKLGVTHRTAAVARATELRLL